MGHGSLDRIKHAVEIFTKVLRQKTQNEVSVFLEENILSSVPTIRVSIFEMLITVQLDDDFLRGTNEIDFHAASVIEGYWQKGVEKESILGGGQALQAVIKKALAGTPSLWVMRLGNMDKEPGERGIHAVSDQASHAGGIILFPLRIKR